MTKTEYAEYETAVADFFKREGITTLSTISGEPFFSWSPCDCCGRPLGGNRVEANGDNPTTREVCYSICIDCVYYAEYGRLDDQTMLDMEAAEA